MSKHVGLLAAVLSLCITTAAFAGAQGGPRRDTVTIKANSTITYRPITFVGGELARVEVIGDGSSDLDLYIYDEDGVLVTFDDALDDTPLCTWRPRFTQQYTLKVVNLGRANTYIMKTN